MNKIRIKKPLRIIFAGTPDFAAKHLSVLLASQHHIVAAFTQPDRPAGRGNCLTASPVKLLANQYGIPVYQPNKLNTVENQQAIAVLNADIMIVVAYGLIIPKKILVIPPLGCINVHGSLLPRWRGAAPIQRACLAGDQETGITIMQMDEGLDTGDMLYRVTCDIDPDDTSGTLYNKLAKLGPVALLKTLNELPNQCIKPQKQDTTQATYAEKLTKQEAKLNWQCPAIELNRAVRAFNPWPVSYFDLAGQSIKVWASYVIEEKSAHPPGTIIFANKQGIAVATSDGQFVMTQLQAPGRKIIPAHDFLNANRPWFTVGHSLL